MIFVQAFLFKRVNARKHFINYQPQRPIIDFLAVPSASDNLRSYVLWRTTKRKCNLFFFFFYFTQPKIRYPKMTLTVHQNVFWFKISVNYAIAVQALQRQNHLCGVKTCSVLLKAPILLQVVEELSTVDIVHHEVQLIVTLKS